MAKYKLVVKPDLCAGCERCMLACSLVHTDACSPTFSRIKIAKDYFDGKYLQRVCKQCLAPSCLTACPAGAMNMDPETGVVLINDDKCLGCKICVNTCPLEVIYFDEKRNKAFKCDLCDGNPQCVEVCPMRAIDFVKIA
jgi:Fe-S-cluster-containing dehydrogenase component